MRVYQIEADDLARQLKTDLVNGYCADVGGQKESYAKRFLAALNGMINLHRSKLYYVNIITILCYGIALLFSFLNKSWPLMHHAIITLCVTALLYLAEGFFLYRYKSAFYKRLEENGHQIAVIRNGKKMNVLPGELVLGDLLCLEEGTILYADARIVSGNGLLANEQMVFDSTIAAEKDSKPISQENLLPEKQKNMLWKGSFVTAGTGLALVVALGNDCYVEKTGGREWKKQRSFFYNRQNNIGHIASYIFIIFATLGLLLSVLFTNHYIEAFLTMAAITSLMMLNPVSCLMEWTYYRTALKLYEQGALIRNIEAFDGMSKEKKLYFDAEDLLKNSLSYSHIIDFTGKEQTAISYFSLCAEKEFEDILQRPLAQYCLDSQELNRNYPMFRKTKDHTGNSFSVFANNGNSVAVAVGYWQKMLPLVQGIEDSLREQICELEAHGNLVYLMASDSMDFIPSTLDSDYFSGRMKLASLVVFHISVHNETLSMINQMRRASMKTYLISSYSGELSETLAGMYDIDGVLASPPETPCYTLPHLKEQNLAVFSDASPIEREQAMLVLSRDMPPHKVIYNVKCMFCGIRRCMNFLAVTGFFFLLAVVALTLSGISIEKIVYPAILLKLVLLCPCYYLIESVRNCNQHRRSLILGLFCGIVGFVAALIHYELALLALELSCLSLSVYLMIASLKHRKIGKKEVLLLLSAVVAVILPWIFIPGNWTVVLILACFSPVCAMVLDLFY